MVYKLLDPYTSTNSEKIRLLSQLRDYFDPLYYCGNQNVQELPNEEEVEKLFFHFLKDGWQEGRSPSHLFDVSYYLKNNPDIAQARINPLIHYVINGKKEGRECTQPHTIIRNEIQNNHPPEEAHLQWTGTIPAGQSITSDVLLTRLKDASIHKKMILSISHDDYYITFGGIQNVIGNECLSFQKYGWSYLNISPTIYPLGLADNVRPEQFVVRLRLNNELLGYITFATLLTTIITLVKQNYRIPVIVHHLMRQSPELLSQLIQCTKEQATVWIHDYFTLCRYTLLRNYVSPCNAPNIDSMSCSICYYLTERKQHLPRIQRFFETTQPNVLAPSQVALDKWLNRANYKHKQVGVIPLAKILMDQKPMQPVNRNKYALRIAHIGARIFLKGWNTFEALALEFAQSGQYEFYQLGYSIVGSLPGCVKHIPVETTVDNRDAMIKAIIQHRIDVVINWSLFDETFSFTTYEALAGGAFIITRRQAGNIWPAIQQSAPEQGMALDTEQELMHLFSDTKFAQRLRTTPRRLGLLFHTGNTANWIEKNL